MDDKKIASGRRRALIAFCRDLFNSNIIGTDLDDVQMFGDYILDALASSI